MSDPSTTVKPEKMDRDRFKVVCPHCAWPMTGWLNPANDEMPSDVNRNAPKANCARCELDYSIDWNGAPVYEPPPQAA